MIYCLGAVDNVHTTYLSAYVARFPHGEALYQVYFTFTFTFIANLLRTLYLPNFIRIGSVL